MAMRGYLLKDISISRGSSRSFTGMMGRNASQTVLGASVLDFAIVEGHQPCIKLPRSELLSAECQVGREILTGVANVRKGQKEKVWNAKFSDIVPGRHVCKD